MDVRSRDAATDRHTCAGMSVQTAAAGLVNQQSDCGCMQECGVPITRSSCPMVPTHVVTRREVFDRGTLWQRSILRKGGVPITCSRVRWFRLWSHAAKLRWATSREGGQTCSGARPHHAIPSPVAPTMVTCREAALARLGFTINWHPFTVCK